MVNYTDKFNTFFTALMNENESRMRRERHSLELLDAISALGAMPDGFCFCSTDRVGDDSKIHEPECADLRKALDKVNGTTKHEMRGTSFTF